MSTLTQYVLQTRSSADGAWQSGLSFASPVVATEELARAREWSVRKTHTVYRIVQVDTTVTVLSRTAPLVRSSKKHDRITHAPSAPRSGPKPERHKRFALK